MVKGRQTMVGGFPNGEAAYAGGDRCDAGGWSAIRAWLASYIQFVPLSPCRCVWWVVRELRWVS